METNQRVSTLFSFVMIVATATLGWFTLKDAGLPRAGESRFTVPASGDVQDVAARLWEDPLQAVQQAIKSGSTPPGVTDNHDLETLSTTIAGELDRNPDHRFALLVVPIPDTPYPDDFETRLRYRYSVQMALADRNYYPANRNYLGYVQLKPGELGSERVQLGSILPYEWFIPRRSQQASDPKISPVSVLVLWLPESRLAHSPLQVLATLADKLGGAWRARFNGLFMVGPESSDTLKVLIRQAQEQAPISGLARLKDKFALFSARATAPDAVLGLKARGCWSDAREELARALHLRIDGDDSTFGAVGSWRYVRNFIASDDQLTDLLVSELQLREIDLQQNEILVLAEADTAYGRSLQIALQASVDAARAGMVIRRIDQSFHSPTPYLIQKRVTPPPAHGPNPYGADKFAPLLSYRYLRGLDQQKGAAQSLDKSTAKTVAKTPEEMLTTAMSRQGAMPLGESQLDYVDRLVRDIGADAGNRKPIRAVAVLGADIYDKTILLRSLRPRFPDAVFLTTDLDARLWHPDHLRFTRNLVVASAADVHGVKSGLNAAQIPPFRDVYQVTIFKACRAALTAAANSPDSAGDDILAPAIFEIGRSGPRQLVAMTSLAGKPSPWPASYSRSVVAVIATLTGLLLAMGIYVRYYTERKLQLPPPLFEFGISLAFCSVIAFGLWAHYEFQQQPGGEPWSLDEGISAWPTEIFRLTIMYAILACLVGAWRHHRQFRTLLAKRYNLGAALPRRHRWESRQVWLENLELLFSRRPDPGPPRKSHKAVDLFAEYLQRARSARRAPRVLTATAVYFFTALAFMFFLHGGFPPNTHIRGDFARTLDKVMMFASVLSFLAFIFYVLDAVFITAQLLAKIRLRTEWPERLLRRKQEQFRVLDEDLDGFLDVSFAAEISEDLGRLIYLPFIIQFLFILSRNSYFDHWTWPPALVAIFAGNFALACIAWGVLRQAAKRIRQSAVHDLENLIHKTEQLDDRAQESPRHKDLQKMRRIVEDENRGAYARIFQDPALLAMLLPSGVFGIAVILGRALFSGS